MEQVRFDEWLLQVDRAATEQAYQLIAPGPETCGCAACRNFVAVRARLYPPEFRQLCARLGIQVGTEREVYDCGRTQDGRQLYGGWFHFVGRIETTPKDEDHRYTCGESGFTMYFTEHLALVPEVLKGRPVVQVEFNVTAPWVLDEPAPD